MAFDMPGCAPAPETLGSLPRASRCFCDELVGCYSDFLQDRDDDAFLVLQQGGEQVQRQQLRVAVLGGERLAF